ncbi:MAG: tetratricopeptide repeat protein [Planctomycetaceae bacterium]
MRRNLPVGLLLCSIALAFAGSTAFADHKATIRYPRVYGWTGTPYGPTQAHYQYERQYGRPWHGYGGNSVTISVGRGGLGGQLGHFGHAQSYLVGHPAFSTIGGFGYGYGHYAGGIQPIVPYYGYGNVGYGTSLIYPGQVNFAYSAPVYGYLPPAPMYLPGQPVFVGQSPFDNSVMRNALVEEQQRWHQPLVLDPVPSSPRPVMQPSTPEAQIRALRLQANGDTWFRQQNLAQARANYQRAIDTARDLPDPRFRMAFTLVALNRHAEAVAEIRKALEIDPAWPTKSFSLTDMYSADNHVAKVSAIHRVTTWAKQDIRDPDRLFLLGVMLHCDGDRARAAEFFETAYRLRGGGEHLAAFLASYAAPAADGTPVAVDPAAARAAQQPATPQPLPVLPAPVPAPETELVIPPLPAPADPRPGAAPPNDRLDIVPPSPSNPFRPPAEPAEPAVPALPFPEP